MKAPYLERALGRQSLQSATVAVSRDEVMREAAVACYVAGKSEGAHSERRFGTLPALITDVADTPYAPMVEAWLEEAVSDAAMALGARVVGGGEGWILEAELPERDYERIVERARVVVRRYASRRVVVRWLLLTGFDAGSYEAAGADDLAELRRLRIFGRSGRITPFW